MWGCHVIGEAEQQFCVPAPCCVWCTPMARASSSAPAIGEGVGLAPERCGNLIAHVGLGLQEELVTSPILGLTQLQRG